MRRTGIAYLYSVDGEPGGRRPAPRPTAHVGHVGHVSHVSHGGTPVRTIVKGKNIDVRSGDREYAERKLARLARLLDDRSDAIVELSVERHRSEADSHIVEVTLVINGQTLRSTAASLTHRAGIDEVVDKIERRAVDFKEKPRLRARPDEEKAILRRIADGEAESGHARRIVKVKRFDIEPSCAAIRPAPNEPAMPSAWRAASGLSCIRLAAVAAATNGPQAPWKWKPRDQNN